MPTPKGASKPGLPDKIVSMPGKAAGMSRHGMRFLVGVVLLLAAFLIGYSLGAVQTKQSYQKGLSDGWENARQKVADSGMMPNPVSNSLSGTITEVGSDYVKIQVPQTVLNPLEQPAPLTRKVTIDSDTTIEQLRPLTDTEREDARDRFFELQEEFEEALAAGETATPPDPSIMDAKITTVSLSDLETGMSVTVRSEDDIATIESFTADAIRVQESSQPTSAPPSP